MANHESYQQIENVLELHPLDEFGSAINSLLEESGHRMETLHGESTSRNIQHADLSFFFCRIDSPGKRQFKVGIDLVHNDELVPVCTYQWDIYDPSASQFTKRDIDKLRTVLNVAARAGKLGG